MIFETVENEGVDAESLFSRFRASRDYIAEIAAKQNSEARRQSLAGLVALARALARAGIPTETLRLVRAPSGKPYLLGGEAHFSVSHSGARAACVVAASPVGLDLEEVRPRPNIGALVCRFFSPGEQKIYDASSDKLRAFYEIWTGKEAVLKQSGRGIDCRLSEVDTTALRIAAHGDERYVWSIFGTDGV